MTKNIKDLIKPVMSNGKLVTHEVTDPSLKIKNCKSSTLIQKLQILVKGEWGNLSVFRGPLLIFFDLESEKVKGEPTSLRPGTKQRFWTDFQLGRCQLGRSL